MFKMQRKTFVKKNSNELIIGLSFFLRRLTVVLLAYQYNNTATSLCLVVREKRQERGVQVENRLTFLFSGYRCIFVTF